MDAAVTRMVQQWTRTVNCFFATLLHGHTSKAVALFSIAMCLSGHCRSGLLSASMITAAKPASSRRRWERLLANDAWDGAAALGQLAAALLAPWTGGQRRLLLVLDETPGHGDLRSMRLGVAYRKRLLTIAAACYPKDKPPMAMPRLIARLIKQAAAVLPDDARVTFLCDRGLAWPSVMDAVRKEGWSHVLRLQRSTRIKLPPPDGRTHTRARARARARIVCAGDLVKRRGRRTWHGRATIFKKAGWRDAHASIVWDKRSREPWILAAPPDDGGLTGLHAAAAYAKRAWCEQTFRDEKSNGFHWDQCQVRDPDRLMRLLVVMTLATLLSISLGTWVIKSGRRREFDPHRHRRLSVFQLGLRWLHRLLVLIGGSDPPAAPDLPDLPYLHPS